MLDLLDSARTDGFVEQFVVAPDCRVVCGCCDSAIAAGRLTVHRQDRLEGASDAADMLLVVRVECPVCAARGVVTLGYGPNASAPDADVLGALPSVGAPTSRPQPTRSAADATADVGTGPRNSMRILIAVDDTVESRSAAITAFEMFGPAHEYTIMSVASRVPIVVSSYGIGSTSTPIDLTNRLDAAADEAAERVADLVETALPGSADTVTGAGDPGVAICATAEENDVGLVVIGAHQHGFWSRLLDPSVGRYVTEHAPCPVLVVR